MRSCGMNWVTSTIPPENEHASMRTRLWNDLQNCHKFRMICGIGASTGCSVISFSSSTVICGTGTSTFCCTTGRRVELLFAVRERAAPPFFAATRHVVHTGHRGLKSMTEKLGVPSSPLVGVPHCSGEALLCCNGSIHQDVRHQASIAMFSINCCCCCCNHL